MNWRTASNYMTEDEAWNELADLEMLGIHYNLEEREMGEWRGEWRVVSEWLPQWWAESLCQGAKAHFELLAWELEEKMGKNIICGKCGGLKRIETEPCEYDSTSGSSSTGFCGCSDQEIEEDIEEAVETVREAREMVQAYADYAKQEIRFCPYCGAALGML